MSKREDFWFTWKGFLVFCVVATLAIAACFGGIFWAAWEFEKKNYREYCHARGWEYREAGGRMWCE